MTPARGRLVFESFGLIIEVFSDDHRLLAEVPRVLPPGWREAPGADTDARFGVMRDGRVICDDREAPDRLENPLATLERELRHHIALHAPAHVFIHAGVVAVGAAAIVIPGRTFAGKTTLVARLVDEGATYYSDEYAAVDAAGMIHPFAKPLSVRAPGSRQGTPRYVAPARTGTEPARAGVIVVTWYQPNVEWKPRTATAGDGALALLANTVAARSRPEESLAAAGALAATAAVLIGARGEAADITTALLRLCAPRSEPVE